MNPIRVLAIAPTSFFADYGCHVRIRGQLATLQARGHRVLLVTYPSGRDVDQITTRRAPAWGRNPIQVGSSRRKLLLDAMLGPTAALAALQFRPHVIHGYLHEGALIGAVLAWLLRTPLVFDYQGSLTGEMLDHRFLVPDSPWLGPLRWMENWINRRPSAVMASSRHAVASLVGEGIDPGTRERVTVLADSVAPNHFRPSESFDPRELASLREALKIPPAAQVLVYLGLLAPYQGTDHLLQALALLAHAVPPVHLLLMGFPFIEHYRQRAAELGILEKVTFTGPVPYEDAPLHLALGQVAIAPKLSATEGSGKLLPYMASALPVAAFDTPVHREYLGELGEYATAGDVPGLARAMGRLLDSPEVARGRGRALRLIAESQFSWEAAAERIETVYQTVLGNRVTVL